MGELGSAYLNIESLLLVIRQDTTSERSFTEQIDELRLGPRGDMSAELAPSPASLIQGTLEQLYRSQYGDAQNPLMRKGRTRKLTANVSWNASICHEMLSCFSLAWSSSLRISSRVPPILRKGTPLMKKNTIES